MNLADQRKDYTQGQMSKSELDPDPIRQFQVWFEDAAAHPGIYEANAMTLSTCSAGEVSARVVLLKGYDQEGFSFFTNYESNKGRQLAANPGVCLSFYWGPQERQIIIRGKAQQLDRAAADAYFARRPRASQIGAWASAQSRPVESRGDLERSFAEYDSRFSDGPVPTPPNWGGYRVSPASLEFWQGRASRLHDRFLYRREGDAWNLLRLQP